MSTKTVERELLELEKQYWQAIKDKDVEAAMRLTDDPCIVAGAQGVGRIDKKSFASMMRDATYTLHDFDVKDDAEVRMLGDDVAILAYKVRERLTVDGKPVTLEAADASTWVRRRGRWLCALHTESITGDPFGRDRRRADPAARGRAEAQHGVTSDVVQLTRRFAGAPDAVFDAWIDRDAIKRWIRASSADDEILRLQTEPRVGGRFSFLVRRGGRELDHVGEYLEVDRPRRLAFTFDAIDATSPARERADRGAGGRDRGPEASVVTLELARVGAETELRLTHEGVPRELARRVEDGWSSILDSIASSVASLPSLDPRVS